MTVDELQALLEQIPMPAALVTESRIVAVNALMCSQTGWRREELLRGNGALAQFVAPEDRERLETQHQARLRGELVPAEFDFRRLAPGGEVVPARVRVAEFPLGGPATQLFLLTDERVRAHAADLIRGFVDTAIAAQQERTREKFFQTVRGRLIELGLTSTVLEIDGDRFRIAPFSPALTKAGAEVRERLDGWTPLSRFPLDVASAEGMLIDDLPRFFAALNQMPPDTYVGRIPLRAVVAAIRIAGEPRYVLSASSDDLDSAVANAFGLLGRQLSAALDSTLRVEELDRRNAELTLLLELGQEVVAALEVAQVLEKAVHTATHCLRASCAYIMLIDEAGTALRVAARDDPGPAAGVPPGESLRLDQASLSGLAFRTRQPQVSLDLEADPRVDPEVSRRFGSSAAVSVPLLSHGRALGVLTIYERGGQRVFDAQDVRLATHAAQLISPALENARLYAEQRSRAEEMSALNDVARQLAGSLDLDRQVELGGETVRRLLDCDVWFAMMPDEKAGGLRLHTPQAEYQDLAGLLLRFDEAGVSTEAYRERRPVQYNNPGSPRLAEASQRVADRMRGRTALGLPLLARDEVLGVLMVLDQRRLRTFSPAEMERAQAVAGQVALALLSTRLYEDLRRSYAELARTQKELIDRERLAALGELSASIAHEVRNPLGVIFNSVGSLRRLLKPQGDVALLLDIVGEEADRLNRMVGDLLDYSRPVRPALEPLPLEPLIAEALAVARQQIGPGAEGVRERVAVAHGAATLRADARLLRQALVNLFLNSYQAMPRSGALEVRAERVERDGLAVAEVHIRDTGAGIPLEARQKIFQPFFTTKAMGTGLGLAVVRRIIEGHGGTIDLIDARSGAHFQLRLPL